MSEAYFTTVQLQALVSDAGVQLFDANGEAITTLPAELIGLCDIKQVEWAHWASKQVYLTGNRSRHHIENRDEWLRWSHAVVSGNNKRRSRTRTGKVRKRKPLFSWDAAVPLMVKVAQNRERYASTVSADPWSRWAETVRRNSAARQSRRKARESDCQGT